MKKLQSLSLSKFKKQELKTSQLNAIHGGNTRNTNVGGVTHADTYNNNTAKEDANGNITWPSADVQIGRIGPAL
jgi:natural product precursor